MNREVTIPIPQPPEIPFANPSRPPPSTAPAPGAPVADDSTVPDIRETGRRVPGPSTLDQLSDLFTGPEEADEDYAQACKAALGEFLAGQDNPIDAAKRRIREARAQGLSYIEAVRHPIDTIKRYLQERIDEHIPRFDVRRYFATLQQSLLDAETPRRREELERFKEKWGERCVEYIYTNHVEPGLQQAYDDLSNSENVNPGDAK